MMFTHRFRRIREAAGLTQSYIQKRTGLSLAIVKEIEAGNTVPSLEVLELWADALSVPLERLFFDGAPPLEFKNLPGRLNSEQIAKASGLGIRIVGGRISRRPCRS